MHDPECNISMKLLDCHQLQSNPDNFQAIALDKETYERAFANADMLISNVFQTLYCTHHFETVKIGRSGLEKFAKCHTKSRKL